MRIDKTKLSVAFGAVGALLLVLVLLAGGFTAVFTPKADLPEEISAAAAHSGKLHRPYVETDFNYVTFSGLYLTDEKDAPAVWVMWGFGEDAVTCFYRKADKKDLDGDGVFDENDAPADEYGVRYVLRAPEPSFADHDKWARDQSVFDTADYYGISEGEVAKLFTDGVMEAARSSRMTARIAFAGGMALLVVGAGFFLLDSSARKLREELRLQEEAAAEEEAPEDVFDEEDADEPEEQEVPDEELDAEALAAGEAMGEEEESSEERDV